jgi:hypothetical protein
VWEDERNGSSDVYLNYSSDYGITWQSSDKKLGMIPYNPNPQFPMVACDNNGHVYAAWNDNYFNTSNDYGATWLAQARRISTIGGEETQLTCDQNGHVYATWRLGTTDVLFNYSIDYGATWQSMDRIISNAGAKPYGGLSLDNDESGHVYVAWHDGRTNTDYPDVYFNSSSDYGNTWRTSDIRLNTGTPGTTFSIWPEVDCDGTGHIYVTWYDRRNGLGDIFVNYSSDYGDSWQVADRRLDTDTPGAIDSGYPEIAVDNGGNVYVLWVDDQTGIGLGLYMNYSLDNGTTWLSANRKIGSSGLNPQMVTDGSRFYIIWDNNDILFKEVASTAVPPFKPADPFPLNGATQVSFNPSPVLSWRFGDANLDDILTYDIYFGTSSPPPLVSLNQAETIYTPGSLALFTTYYWQVVAKDSATQTAGPIWSFKTMSGPPQFLDFSPSDGATGVPFSPPPTLSWNAIDPDGDALTYDVYFGNAYPPPLRISNYPSNTFNPGMLSRITVYYWKVVAKDTHGTTAIGPVLSFTTINEPPQFYSGQYHPLNGDTGADLALTTLQWSAHDPDPGDTITYDVYFGSSLPPPLVSFNQTAKSYSPGALSHCTDYYWKIVARDNHGAETGSPDLSFTTLNHPPTLVSFNPPHLTTGVSITPTLRWSFNDPDPGDTASLTYDVYFGTASSPPLVVSNQTATNYLPGTLSSFTTYYWKIVARDHHHPHCNGETTLPIFVSFTTTSLPPQFVYPFSPDNGASGVNPLVTLSWSASDPDPGDTLTFDVYLATHSPLQPEDRKTVNQTTPTYKPGNRSISTQYFWKIVARDNHGVETESSTLSFTTGIPLVECSFASVPVPPTIHRGGILAFQATVKNNTDKTGTVLFATKVTKPDHSLYPLSGYLIGPLNANLVPYGSTPPYQISHTIPSGAPLGTYTYHGYVGRVGVGLIYECQFDFEVTL